MPNYFHFREHVNIDGPKRNTRQLGRDEESYKVKFPIWPYPKRNTRQFSEPYMNYDWLFN